MPYARFDDRYDDHRKIKRALRREPAAVAMHAMAITYSNRFNTDGAVDGDWVDEKLALMPYKPAQRRRILDLLLELRLFEVRDDETFLVHDFLDWNLSSAQRKAFADQGRKGGSAPRGSSGPGSDGSSPGSSNGSSQGSSSGPSSGSSPSGDGGSSTPLATPTPTPSQASNSNAELRSAVIEVFAYWQDRCGHQQAALSPDRRGKIETRLRERAKLGGGMPQAIADIRLAIDGAALAAFVDERGKRHDDIELICRKGSKLEDFMGRASLPAQGGQVLPINRKSTVSELHRKLMANEGEAS
jgi:hypothetical protein